MTFGTSTRGSMLTGWYTTRCLFGAVCTPAVPLRGEALRNEHPWLDAHRLVHHPLLVRVVLHLDVAAQREVLAEGMPDEAIVGEDAAQVRMAAEENAVEIE